MGTATLSVDPADPDPAAIRRAADLIRDADRVRDVAAAWPEAAARLAARFWPGPLTVVVPRRAEVPDVVTAGGPTVAVRCPAHAVARALIREADVPVAAPSANRSTELSPTRAEHVLKGLDGRIDLVLDGGPCPGGIESTVVDVTGDVVRLLRPGLVTAPMLEEVVGRVEQASRGCEPPGSVARSPGQMTKHYSPRTPIVLASTNEEAFLLGREFSAVFAANDLSAMGVISALTERGWRVPYEVSVVGFDDLRLAAFTSPPLTTIHQPAREIAERATQLLLDVSNGKRVQKRRHLLEPRLVVRGSTDVPGPGPWA